MLARREAMKRGPRPASIRTPEPSDWMNAQFPALPLASTQNRAGMSNPEREIPQPFYPNPIIRR